MNKFKLITYIDRINFFSEKFISYYTNIFDRNEFYFLILDNEYDVITNYLLLNGFELSNFKKITRKDYGFGDTVSLQNEIKKVFLSEGNIVIYVDIDEIIYHPNLKEYVIKTEKTLLCPQGYSIIQDVDENVLDESKNILLQRNKCKKNFKWYSKVCILKEDYKWSPGRHNNHGVKIDDELFLFDIGKICSKLCLENNKKTKKIYKKISNGYTELKEENINKKFNDYRENLIPFSNLNINNNIF